MKKLIYLSCLVLGLLSFKTHKTGSIEFFHIGDCDKYIQKLIYTKTIDSFSVEEVYVKVSDKDFDILQNYLIINSSNNTCDSCYQRYGTFKVSMVTNNNRKVYYIIESRKRSLAFFTNFKNYLIDKKVDDKIIQKLDQVIIKRIDHPAPIEREYETEEWKKRYPNLN